MIVVAWQSQVIFSSKQKMQKEQKPSPGSSLSDGLFVYVFDF